MRPTSEQFDAALAFADEHGIGVERALLLQQQDEIAAVQDRQSARREADFLRVAFQVLTPIVEQFNVLMRDLTSSPLWPQVVAIAEAKAKQERRAANRARWQARRRSH